uniref:Uncharacterized protein n=1 Tax=Glossina palpalis gambiensis TaxID=67801 RepID=A0A1B0B1Z1_9MUSC
MYIYKTCPLLCGLIIKIGFTSRVHKAKVWQGTSLTISDVENPQPSQPTLLVARAIARESWRICFGEFQFTDIADEESLCTHLFNEGIVCVIFAFCLSSSLLLSAITDNAYYGPTNSKLLLWDINLFTNLSCPSHEYMLVVSPSSFTLHPAFCSWLGLVAFIFANTIFIKSFCVLLSNVFDNGKFSKCWWSHVIGVEDLQCEIVLLFNNNWLLKDDVPWLRVPLLLPSHFTVVRLERQLFSGRKDCKNYILQIDRKPGWLSHHGKAYQLDSYESNVIVCHHKY